MMPAKATDAVPWMSSLKLQIWSRVLAEQTKGVGVAKVLPLQQRLGVGLLDGGHELGDKRVVLGAPGALLIDPDVQRILMQFRVVGADIERDGEAVVRMQAGAGGVEGQLADRDAHAERAEVAQAEDALAVGDDDHAHVQIRPMSQDFRDAAAFADADEQSARAPEDRTNTRGRPGRPWAYR